jgi:hypothetical protein
MFGKSTVVDMINRSATSEKDRRNFLRTASLAGMGVVGGAALLGTSSTMAEAADAPTDTAVLNFALNLEYLEAEFYYHAIFGRGLPDSLLDGKGEQGGVWGGHKVPWKTPWVYQAAKEIAIDEQDHVAFLRKALGNDKVAQPWIDLKGSFTAAAQAAGLIKAGQSFDPFASEANFLLGAFIFEDVGVTAYKGAAPLISNKAYLEAAAGILSVEAYHAGTIRTALVAMNLGQAANKISNARDSLDGKTDLDQGPINSRGRVNIVPTDGNGITFSRSPEQVLNIAYLTPKKVSKGGFFPHGTNGTFKTSGSNA